MICPKCGREMNKTPDWNTEIDSLECFCGYKETRPMPRCSESGCDDVASTYEIDDEQYILCAEHASDNGFCVFCGHFVAGGDDRHLHRTGLCDDCYRMKRDDERAEIDELHDW